jgi:hypothetical protein
MLDTFASPPNVTYVSKRLACTAIDPEPVQQAMFTASNLICWASDKSDPYGPEVGIRPTKWNFITFHQRRSRLAE